MITERIKNLRDVLQSFKGDRGEPSNEIETYILQAMWVMMLSEFEGSLKSAVEAHIDTVKKRPIEEIHICLLLKNFYPHDKQFTYDHILNVQTKKPDEITYSNFTQDKKAKYKSSAVENLFKSLGIFLTSEEALLLKTIDSIASTRDAIAHGDRHIEITKTEAEHRLTDLEKIYLMLESRLSFGDEFAIATVVLC
jgi:hypothetical protein